MENVYIFDHSQFYEPLGGISECTVDAENRIKQALDAHNFYYAKCAQGLLQVPSTSGGEASSNFCYRSRKPANFITLA